MDNSHNHPLPPHLLVLGRGRCHLPVTLHNFSLVHILILHHMTPDPVIATITIQQVSSLLHNPTCLSLLLKLFLVPPRMLGMDNQILRAIRQFIKSPIIMTSKSNKRACKIWGRHTFRPT